ncbi:MAG: hypothetical protein QXV17_13805 [Candidatus Micrarchaeaceae archaeon]
MKGNSDVYVVFSRYLHYKNPPGCIKVIGIYSTYVKASKALDSYIRENNISNFDDYEYGIMAEVVR